MLNSMITSIVTKSMAKKLANNTIQEDDIKEVIREIRISLIDADVNLSVVKKFINNIKEKTVGQVVSKDVSPSDFVLKIIKEELVEILGKNEKTINFKQKTNKIMMVGLQGSGKTTTCAKLALYARNKEKKNPLLVACDVYRPAAIDQLKQLANQNKFDFYDHGTQDPTITIKEVEEIVNKNKNDFIIVDTAGRLQTDEKLMDELVNIKKILKPDEILLVVDSMSGQDIVNVANEFNNKLNLTGIIVTKMDSDARAGAALSLVSILNVPIKFIGMGEKIAALDLFYPERIADRILGLGDVLTLAEKAMDVIDEKKAKSQLERLLSGKMDLEDLYTQMEQINKMGSIGGIMGMIPGLNKKLTDEKEVEIEEKMKVMRVLLDSMTIKERRNPRLLKKDASRRLRIVRGSGRNIDELNKLLKRWEEGNKKISNFSSMIKSGNNPFSGGNIKF